jgi:hypothetical protein
VILQECSDWGVVALSQTPVLAAWHADVPEGRRFHRWDLHRPCLKQSVACSCVCVCVCHALHVGLLVMCCGAQSLHVFLLLDAAEVG